MCSSIVLLYMSQDLYQIFRNVPEISPTSQLEGRIFQAIMVEKDRVNRKKVLVSRLGLGTSAAVFLMAIFTFGGTVLQSEFWNIVSLASSDMLMVAKNWQDFMYSMLETFPTVSVVAILVPVMMLMYSASIYLETSHRHKYI